MRLTHKKAYEKTSLRGSISHTLSYSVTACVSPIKRQVFWLGFFCADRIPSHTESRIGSIQWYLSADPHKPYSGGTAQVFHLFPYYPLHRLCGGTFSYWIVNTR